MMTEHFQEKRHQSRKDAAGGTQFTFQLLSMSYKGDHITLQQASPVLSIQSSQHYERNIDI